MRDVTADAFGRARDAVDTLASNLAEAGYEVIDTPLLEETELFVRKSGGEIPPLPSLPPPGEGTGFSPLAGES